MLNLRTTLALCAVVALTAPVAFAAPADAPRVVNEPDDLTLANDHVTVHFDNGTPALTVYAGATKTETPAYAYSYDAIVEYRDANGNGKPDANEIVARLGLADNTGYDIQTMTDGDLASVTFDLEAPARLAATPAGPPGVDVIDRNAHVTLTFTAHRTATSLAAETATFKVAPSLVTSAIAINTWPWLDATEHRLAILTTSTGVVMAEPGDAFTAATVTHADTLTGVLAWAREAPATLSDETEATVPVVSRVTHDETAKAEHELAASAIAFTFDGPDIAQAHFMGALGVPPAATMSEAADVPNVGERLKDVPAPAGAVIVAAVAIVAVGFAFALRRS